MPKGELAKRVAVASVGIPVAAVAIYLGGWVLGVLLAVVAAGGALELYRLAATRGVQPFAPAGAVAAATFVLVAAALPEHGAAAAANSAIALGLLLAVAAAAVWRRSPAEGRPLAAVAITVLGGVYTGGTLAYGVLLRHLPDVAGSYLVPVSGSPSPWAGTAVVAFPLALTWLNDTYAYFGGHAWGRRRLMPTVSPGKTVAGAVTAFIGTVATGAVYAALFFRALLDLPLPFDAAGAVGALLFGGLGGAVVSVSAQIGDLVESLFKREAGVKDSGRFFPGHGGLLDRFDALFFTLPVAYAYFSLTWFVRVGLP